MEGGHRGPDGVGEVVEEVGRRNVNFHCLGAEEVREDKSQVVDAKDGEQVANVNVHNCKQMMEALR